MAAFTYKVCKHPVIFSKLEILNLDSYEFCSAQTATKEHG